MSHRYSIVIPLETPSKKNSRIVNRRTGRSFPSKNYTDWHRVASGYVMASRRPETALHGPLYVSLHFIHGTHRRCDSDNKVSSILDLLVDCGVLSDDSWDVVRSYSVANGYLKDSPSCTVEIYEADGDTE